MRVIRKKTMTTRKTISKMNSLMFDGKKTKNEDIEGTKTTKLFKKMIIAHTLWIESARLKTILFIKTI